MEPIGFSFGAFGALGRLESLVLDLKQRFKNHKEAPGKLEEIRLRFQTCRASLASMKSMLEHEWPRGFPEENKDICETDFCSIRDLASSCARQLEDLQQMQFSLDPGAGSWKRMVLKAKLVTRANRVMESLQQLDEDSVKIETFTRHLNSLLGLSHQVASLVLPGSAFDAFVRIFNVPRPSGFEVLDLSLTATPEGQLKHLLLGDNRPSERVAAALGGGSSVALPGVLGMGGVGKTSALIGLGYDADIRTHFFDGVHFLLFGQQAGPADVIAGVAGLVRDSGGSQKAEDVASCSKLGEAVHKAALWFSGRTCLFLCDDLWRSDGRPYGFLPDIGHLLDTSASSKMVISTRDRVIARVSSHQVLFEPRIAEGEIALCIFLRHAGIDPNDMKVYDSAEKLSMRVLAFCGGLPIALAVAGRLLRRYLQPDSNDPVCALRICLMQLERGIIEIGNISAGTYSSFNATVRASLDFLEKDRSGSLEGASSSGVAGEKTIFYLFEAFCVMKHQARLPISALQRLWDLSADESSRVLESLVDLSIISQHTDGQGASSISAHDLVIAYSKDLAERSGRVQVWHKKLLNSYMNSELEADTAHHPVENNSLSFLKSLRPWWDVESDGYIHRNISWHLTHSGLERELGGLVTDMRWTKFRVSEGGLLELENDIDFLLGTLATNDAALGENRAPQELSKDLRILRKALRLSWFSIHRNPGELGFQLYSRLVHHKDSSEIIKKYLKSVEMWNEKPWLRSWHGAEADERLVTEIGVDGECAAAWALDEKRILYAANDLILFNVNRNEEESRIRLEHPIKSLSVAGRSKFVAFGSVEGTVQRWDLDTNSQVGEILAEHSEYVNSVAISGDGRILISGSRDRTVRLRQFDDDENVIGRKCKKFPRTIEAVSISENGKRAASASGNTVTVWDSPGLKKVCKLRGLSYRVTCIAMSTDGKHLVCGCEDGFVRLWNLEGSERTEHPFFTYSDRVTAVSISRDGRRFSAGFVDGSARVWEISTRRQIGPTFGTDKWVSTVALNGNGSRVILSVGQNVSVWDVSEDVDESDRASAHSKRISSVAYSHETNRIASVSWDKTLRLWDTDTGLTVGDPLSLSHVENLPEIVAMSGNGKKVAVYYDKYPAHIRVLDAHERREMGATLSGRSRGLWISGDGEYVVSRTNYGEVRIWDVSTLTEIVRPRGESLLALESGIKNIDEERDFIVLRTGALREMADIQCPARFEPTPSNSTVWKFGIRNRREVVLMNHDKGKFVLGSLNDEIRKNSCVVFQNTRGENVLAAGGSSGKLHWFTIEIE